MKHTDHGMSDIMRHYAKRGAQNRNQNLCPKGRKTFEQVAAKADVLNRLRLDIEHMHMMDVRRELGL